MGEVFIGISYGVLAPPIVDQLTPRGYTLADPEKWERLRTAIHRLIFAGVLTDYMAGKCWERLNREIIANLIKLERPQ